MKVKQVLGEQRGRPRKYAQGEILFTKLWLPENLMMEIRVAARVRKYTTNDEIVSRLVASLNYSPRRPVIKSEEGQRLVAIARLFDEFLQSRLDAVREEYAKTESSSEGKKMFVPGKNKAFSSSFPVNLRRDMMVSARLNKRSMNHEIMVRLLDSFDYMTEQQLPENEEVHRLRELAILFEEFVSQKIGVAENPLTEKNKNEKK